MEAVVYFHIHICIESTYRYFMASCDSFTIIRLLQHSGIAFKEAIIQKAFMIVVLHLYKWV